MTTVFKRGSSQRWAVITGASGGIGKSLASTFTDNGYQVIAIDCVSKPGDLSCKHYLQADLATTVSDEDFAIQLFSQIKEILDGQGLHVLINNAATQILGGVDSLSRQDWQTTLNVNLIAPFIWIQALLPNLEAVKGSVINISSIHAKLTKKNFVAYSTSKAALSGMTRALAVDLGGRLRINAIEPAAIDTPMLRSGFADNCAGYEHLIDCHPTSSLGQAKEIAELALTIVNSQIPFLHGSCIAVDGGISARLHDPA